ncbi:MAG TPA: four helix bundle protein [Blastocatellia bacterium]|nr:four helix bundle protein [Blastocatellia bacterium]
MAENVVLDKSYTFALRTVRSYKYLTEVRKEYIISRRLLADGTDLGAHVKAAQEADGRSNFIHEMSAALQKSSRVEFWLRLLRDSDFLNEQEFDSMHSDNQELFSLLTAIVKTSRSRQ